MPPIALKLSVDPFLLLVALAGSTACSGDSAESNANPNETTPASPPEAETGDLSSVETAVCNTLYDARDIPFMAWTFWISDSCPSQRTGVAPMASSTITQLSLDAGKICLSGRVTTGWVSLILDFSGDNPSGSQLPTEAAPPLDAVGLGITRLQFTLDSPPASGLTVDLASVLVPGCYGRPNDCLVSDYYIMDEQLPGVPKRLNEPGTYTVRIADFQAVPWVDPTRELDPTRLAFVGFDPGMGDYDFCIHDLKLLDDSGIPVGGKR